MCIRDRFNTHQQVVITSRESYALILTATTGVIVALIGRGVQAAIYFLAGLRNTHVEQLLLSWPGSRVSLAGTPRYDIPCTYVCMCRSRKVGAGMGAYACAATADRAHPACAWGSAVDQALPLLRHVERRLRVGGRPHDGGARAPHCHARSKRGVSRAVRAVPHAQVIEPHTAADGVAEIKAFINGTHVKHFLRLRTIVVRVLSTIFAAASGLAAGSEAPLIHIGAGVGSGVTRGDKMRNLSLIHI